MVGGEVTAFTSEVEKARWEAIERAKQRAIALGANAIIGMDVETSGMGSKRNHAFLSDRNSSGYRTRTIGDSVPV